MPSHFRGNTQKGIGGVCLTIRIALRDVGEAASRSLKYAPCDALRDELRVLHPNSNLGIARPKERPIVHVGRAKDLMVDRESVCSFMSKMGQEVRRREGKEERRSRKENETTHTHTHTIITHHDAIVHNHKLAVHVNLAADKVINLSRYGLALPEPEEVDVLVQARG